MPRFKSVVGKWHPSEEITQLPLTREDLMAGKNPIYRGADRGALSLLVEQGYAVEDPNGDIYYYGDEERYKDKRFSIKDLPGRDCRTEPDLIRQSRELGFKSVEEYLNVMHGIDFDEEKRKAEDSLKQIVNHDETPKRRPDSVGVHEKTGPGPYKKGGFGDSSDPQSEAVAKGKG